MDNMDRSISISNLNLTEGLIHPKFAERVASRYVTIYQRDGFGEAQKYLAEMVQGSTKLQEHLVPYIVEEGNRRSK
jgi:hypothetical protein